MRLKRSALGYTIPELLLQVDKTVDVKKSVTSFYKYDSLFLNQSNPLHKPGEIQVEATSFTISEPVEIYRIESIVYKYATEEERIKRLLDNKEYFREIVGYKRQEELIRICGIDSQKKVSEFEYFDLNFSDKINNAFESMQHKYIYKEEYKKSIDDVKEDLKELKNRIIIIE